MQYVNTFCFKYHCMFLNQNIPLFPKWRPYYLIYKSTQERSLKPTPSRQRVERKWPRTDFRNQKVINSQKDIREWSSTVSIWSLIYAEMFGND